MTTERQNSITEDPSLNSILAELKRTRKARHQVTSLNLQQSPELMASIDLLSKRIEILKQLATKVFTSLLDNETTYP